MKTKITQNIKAIILALILVAGVGYASANWTAPTNTPPTCPTGSPGCDAPLHVGSIGQIKGGPLTLGGLGIIGDFKFLPLSGTPPTSGQVLMADDSNLALGKVKWGTVSGGGTNTSDAYQVDCKFYASAPATCLRLNKNTGVIQKIDYSPSDSVTTIPWQNATVYNAIPPFGSAPYSMNLSYINTNLLTFCITDYSGTTKCVTSYNF